MDIYRSVALLLLILLAACDQATEVICGDGLDNDADGMLDCDDPDCSGDAACSEGDTDTDTDADTDTDTDLPLDEDNDGYTSVADGGDDCDDGDASINPGADEYCNGVDDDCDDETDEADSVDASTWYADTDTDAYGDASDSAVACEAPTGMVADDTDCNDAEATTYPGADELVADGIDQDCDGAETCYQDADGDGYGATTTALSKDLDCEDTGEASTDTDPDDSDGSTYPGAPEIPGDGIDQDGNGGDTCYVDGDGDGYGTTTTVASTDLDCDDSGESTLDSDCDDAEATTYPGAGEYCDGHDDDCDGDTDEDDAVDASTWYADTDTDMYGDPLSTYHSCSLPSGYVGDDTDCDDTDASINPGAAELTADGIDQDCNGGDVCYVDGDSDSYGTTTTVVSTDMDCTGSGESVSATDCDDAEATTYPGADEYCDGHDDDCDGDTDEASAVDASTWYADTDDDMYGDPLSTDRACTQPSGYVADDTDCDDSDASINPEATEGTADAVDQNCDGAESCYVDSDGDGYGTTSTVVSTDTDCADSGESTVDTDFDDGEATAYPGAPEIAADGIDQDGDGGDACYEDADGDGYGATTTVASSDLDCDDAGESTDSSDLDDSDGSTYPGAPEIPGDGIDQDGDGGDDCYVDSDADGFGSASTVASADMDCSDAGESDLATDCDDTDTAAYPGATETWYDGTDQDCDGSSDYDQDGDGYDSDAYGGTDCDDTESGAYLGATELCFDSLDNDCDGVTDACELDAGTSAWLELEGLAAGDRAGYALTVAGDTNGDGYQDLLVGAFYADDTDSDEGVAYLLHGPLDGSSSLATADAVFVGESASDAAGGTLARAGDVDGDGLDDMLVGAWNDSTGGTSAGAAYLVLGGVSGTLDLGSADAKLYGTATSSAGASLGSCGDLTGDGTPDLLIGAPHLNSSTGVAYVVSGDFRGTGSIASEGLTFNGEATGDNAGYGLAGMDVNGDGFGDLLIGAPYASATDTGKVYIFNGPVTIGSATSGADATIQGAFANAAIGVYTVDAGDVDGDGYNDLLLGSEIGGAYYEGRTYLVSGPITGSLSLSSATATFIGEGADDLAGCAGPAGDVNGDSYADVLVGAWHADSTGTDAGAAYIVLGPATGSIDLGLADLKIEGEAGGDRLGHTPTAEADLDGDGFQDLVLGAYQHDGSAGADSGTVYLFQLQ